MGMIFSCIYLQLFQLSAAKLVSRQHALDRLYNKIGRVFLQKFLCGCFFDSTHISGVTVVFLVVHFVAGEDDFLGIGNHDKITIINKSGESWLVFTSQPGGYFRCQTAQNLVLCVDNVPFFLDLVDWGKIGFHYIPQMVDHLIKKGPNSVEPFVQYSGAGNEIRTRDVNLGKVALYH